MSIDDMAILLAKVQLGDNRTVDDLVIVYWQDTIGDLNLPDALTALKRYRRERPGQYLEPGHLLELAGTVDPDPDVPDLTPAYLESAKQRDLAAIGVTVNDYDTDPTVRAAADARLDELALEAFMAEEIGAEQ